MRRLECTACHASTDERIPGRLIRRKCLRCNKGILLEPEDCWQDDGSPLPELTQRTGVSPLGSDHLVAKPSILRCYACEARVTELAKGALLGAVCRACGQGKLLLCRD